MRSSIFCSISKINLHETVKKMEKTLATVDKLMFDLQDGKGSMGKLLKDDGMYKNLEGASKELELLLGDMRLNPKRYVHFSLWGKKQVVYKDPAQEKTE